MFLAKGYVGTDYLQAAAKLLEQIKRRSYALMQIRPGHRVLDVGCGPGTDTISLAELVGAGGRVAGVDHDEAMIATADRRALEAGVAARVEHRRAEAASLPFESACFDSCRSERLFQHLPDPERAMAEMARVTKPGGWIVVLDTDHGTWSTDAPDVDLERRLVRFRTERMCYNGYAGRQLYRLFRRRNLSDITVEIVSGAFTNYALWRQMNTLDQLEHEALKAGAITADELSRWRANLERAEAEGVFFGSESMMVVAGRKS